MPHMQLTFMGAVSDEWIPLPFITLDTYYYCKDVK